MTAVSKVDATEEVGSLGPVALVGAGPGDPELLTLKAVRRLEDAEVVLHDNLISEEVLAMVPEAALLVNVGKRCGDVRDRGLQQDEIHELLVRHSRRGKRVVRLKCGDPMVFGRGAEELEYLVKHGVPFEVVPGITSALGAAASCQIPLTHRTFGVNHVRFVVGQCKAKRIPDLDWGELARGASQQTTVFYMGLKQLDVICKTLLENGAPETTPITAVEAATSPQERIVSGTLASLPKLVKEQEVGAGGPVLLVMGPTARFPEHLEQLAGGRPPKRARGAFIQADLC